MKTFSINFQKIIGIIFGTILCIIWIAILLSIEKTFFLEKTIIHGTEVVRTTVSGPVIDWLYSGLIPFLIMFGVYIFGGYEKNQGIIALKIYILGFTIWLLVCVIIHLLQIPISYQISVGAGYLAILILILYNDKKHKN